MAIKYFTNRGVFIQIDDGVVALGNKDGEIKFSFVICKSLADTLKKSTDDGLTVKSAGKSLTMSRECCVWVSKIITEHVVL